MSPVPSSRQSSLRSVLSLHLNHTYKNTQPIFLHLLSFLLVLLILFRIGEDIDVQAELDSDIYNPEYNTRLEYREPVFSPSCILMLKVYTVDRIARNLCCVGYGFLPIFIEVGTTNQPSVSSSEVKVCCSE